MRLLKLKLKDFRRFAGEHALDLNETLIALVGPNEAGKSSLLYALALLGKGERPKPSDVTRGRDGPAEICGLFALTEADRALLKDIHEGENVSHAWVTLRTNDDRPLWLLEPCPRRDRGPRTACFKLIEAIQDDPALDPKFSASDDLRWDSQLLAQVRNGLDSDAESLSQEVLTSIEAVAQRLRALRMPNDGAEGHPRSPEDSDSPARRSREARESAAACLMELTKIERSPTPHQQGTKALASSLPSVAWFGEDDRDLKSDYRVAEIAAAPPAALANLCALAGLDLAQINADLNSGRVPHVEKLLESANARLKERFRLTWTQSSIYPRLGTPSDGVLRILVATEGDEDYSYPSERSDGLRWFIALHAFVTARAEQQPLLLVDEAERHLHYDAQADLVDILMRQKVASKVVYTTHSVGCLPPDLGTGIRAILADSGAERSRIANSYWSAHPAGDQRIGYTPLLFSMGARLLSLTVPRYGVVAEGPSDAVLLPSLFREAANASMLTYRVVPGLAELVDVSTIDHHAGRVVCLTDDDEAGEAIRERLRTAGVPDAMSLHLGTIGSGYTLEDLVLPDVFADAVNIELETWNLGTFRAVAADVPSTQRWRWLEMKCTEAGIAIATISKVRVAQRVVDLGLPVEPGKPGRALLDPDHASRLRDLHYSIVALLRIPATPT